MRVVAIAGEPGTGKSKLVRTLIDRLRSYKIKERPFVLGLIRGHEFPDARLLILGRYDDPSDTFPGTDRLSMAVQPQAVEFLTWAATSSSHSLNKYTVLFEGDRLCNASLFTALRECGIPLRLFVVTAEPPVKLQRYRDRGSSQSDTFLRGRASKTRYLSKTFRADVLHNNTEVDLEFVVHEVAGAAGLAI